MSSPRHGAHKLTIDTNLSSGSRSESRRGKSHRQPEYLSNFPASISRGRQSSSEDSFLENRTPIDSDMPERDRPSSIVLPRDSHDLSLSPRNVTRDSFVTNMLLSLDQFSIGQNGSNQGFDTFDYPQHDTQYPGSWASMVGEATSRGHGHQYSYGSGMDGAEDSSRLSEQTSRERRSESSNPYRMDSVRNNGRINGSPRNTHTRGGKNSKSSSTTSIDTPYAGQHSGMQTRARGISQSTSYEQSQPQPATMIPLQPALSFIPAHQAQVPASPRNAWHQQSDPMSPFQIDFGSSFSEDFDAAPTPTVHSGPRRMPSTPAMAQQQAPPEPLNNRSLDSRKRSSSSRSLKSSTSRRAANGREAVPAVPAVPSFDIDSAPAPNVGYGKSKEGMPGSPAAKSTTAPREKQGFFRKIFGGSSRATNDAAEPPINYRLPSTTEMAERASSRGGPVGSGSQTTLAKSGSVPSTRDTSSSHSHNPPPLQKKPSSFFRRRRKSVNDEQPAPEEAPPIPAIDPALKASPSPLPSPATVKGASQKLRKQQAMPSTPTKQGYLLGGSANATPDASDTNEEVREYKREFSPDYEPSPNARIRAVPPENQGSGKTPSRIMKNPDAAVAPPNDSFLDLDADSDEENLEMSSKKKSAQNKKTGGKEDKDLTIRAAKKREIARIDTKDSVATTLSAANTSNGVNSSSATPVENPSTPTVMVEEAADAKPKTLDEPAFVIGEAY